MKTIFSLAIIMAMTNLGLFAGDSPTATSPGPPATVKQDTVLDVMVDPGLGNKALGEKMAALLCSNAVNAAINTIRFVTDHEVRLTVTLNREDKATRNLVEPARVLLASCLASVNDTEGVKLVIATDSEGKSLVARASFNSRPGDRAERAECKRQVNLQDGKIVANPANVSKSDQTVFVTASFACPGQTERVVNNGLELYRKALAALDRARNGP